jgi:hypothetical protein
VVVVAANDASICSARPYFSQAMLIAAVNGLAMHRRSRLPVPAPSECLHIQGPTGDVASLGRLDDLGRNLLLLEGLGGGVEMVRFLHSACFPGLARSPRPSIKEDASINR